MSGTRPAGAPWASSASRSATSATSTGWSEAWAGSTTTGSLARARSICTTRSWNWVARSTVHPIPDSATSFSTAYLDR